MKWRQLCGLALAAGLAFWAVDLASQLARQTGWVFEPGEVRRVTLSTETRARLASFDEELSLLYCVSPKDDLPTHLAHLPGAMQAGLESLARGFGGPARVAVISPENHPEWAASLASAGLAPWRARRVERDGYREEELWSSLRISYGARPAVVLGAIGPEQARSVQALVLAHLEQLRSPRRPRVAISAPAGFDDLRDILASGAHVYELDFAAHPGDLPQDCDIFFWLGSTVAGPEHLAQLDLLRERGGSAVISVESLDLQERWSDGQVSMRAVTRDARRNGARALLKHTGLQALEGLLLDPRGGEVVGPAGEALVVPWRVRSTPDNHDFRGLVGQPGAPLLMEGPTAFTLDAARLADLGFGATVLASASAGASLHEMPKSEWTLPEAQASRGTPVPRAALVVRLASADAWRGDRIVLADSSLLSDVWLTGEPFGHGAFLGILLSNLSAPERLVRGQVARGGAAPLAELSRTKRLWIRLFTVGAAPLCLLVLLLLRGRGGERRLVAARGFGTPKIALAGSGAAALVILISLATRSSGLDIDATRDARHGWTAAERLTLQDYAQAIEGGVLFEYAFSSDGRLPPEMRGPASELRDTVAALARDVEGVSFGRFDPEGASPRVLSRRGLRRLEFSSSADEVTHLRQAFASVLVTGGGRREVLEFPSPASFLELRFRLAFALERLARGRRPRVALFAEAPRLSPAEAALEYQRRGLFAPRAAGVFKALEELLTGHGFEVLRLGRGTTELPPDLDALLVLQPRRDATPILAELAGHLASGGRALLAAQHHRILARQLERQGLQLFFWPRPQFCDLESLYFSELGLSLVDELLFDSPPGSLEVATRIDRADGSSVFESQPSTQPFFVRCAFDSTVAPLLKGLGEVLLVSPSPIALDAAALGTRGLESRVWAATSEAAWSYAWSGGDIPRAVLEGDRQNGAALQDAGESALCVLLEGRFPGARRSEPVGVAPQLLLDEDSGELPGRLLALGNSEIFRDSMLHLEGYAHASFALRCVAELALEPRLATFLQRDRQAPGLAPLSSAARSGWRMVVMGAAPLLLLSLGLLRRRLA